MITVDIVIPSYRLLSKYLIAVLNMEVPEDIAVHYYIIGDNPDIETPDDLFPYLKKENVTLIRNEVNLGASQTRNAGIEAGNGDWILFLDDDVEPDKKLLFEYKRLIEENPDDIGFFGKTVFPEPHNSFTKGLVAGDMMHFFEMAKYNIYSKCATTSNVIVKRDAVGDIRFSNSFPKKGGGEDFAFFIEIYERTGKALNSAPNADVYHNWWHGGKRDYTQFFRWCYAEFELFRRFPSVTYYDFPNVAEMLLIGIIGGGIASVLTASILPFICIIGGILIGEIAGRFLYMLWAKGLKSSLYVFEVAVARGITDLSRVIGLLENRRFGDLFKRGNFSVNGTNIHYFVLPAIKFIGYLVATALLLCIVYCEEFWVFEF